MATVHRKQCLEYIKRRGSSLLRTSFRVEVKGGPWFFFSATYIHLHQGIGHASWYSHSDGYTHRETDTVDGYTLAALKPWT